MFKTETHMHTSEGSACASASGAQQAEQYKALGYSTIFVTDHFINGNTAADRSLPWERWVDAYCLGYENAKRRGDEIGLNVLFGIEYGWHGTDLLVYGIDKEWLKENPDIAQISVQRFCKRVRLAGGMIVHAHPFRQEPYITELKFIPDYTDAVEVFNAHNAKAVYNERAKWYAEQFSLPFTAGSDCHHIGGGSFSGVTTENEILSAADYMSAVLEGRAGLLEDGI